MQSERQSFTVALTPFDPESGVMNSWQRLKKADAEWFGLFGKWRATIASIAEAATWQTLRSVGSSKIVSLTIAIPFIGYLIIFNDYFIDYAQIARQLVIFQGGDNSANPDIQREISLSNLYFLYFGLVLTGLASIGFALFCPSEIKRSSSVNDFIRSSEEIKSPTLLVDNLEKISYSYVEAMEQLQLDDTSQQNVYDYVSYPERISSLHYNLINRIFEQNPELYGNDEDGEPESEVAEQTTKNSAGDLSEDAGRTSFMDTFPYHQGTANYLDVDRITTIIVDHPRVMSHFVQQFRNASFGFYKDILYLRYNILDNSRPYLRMTIGFVYLIGFILLFVPTAKTLFLILRAAFWM
ncbi:hypothetical protein NKJ36_10235 [Mesorhizobium sp. M0142]|uniref:hypothetical protein n=1 Tax=Mesorhizobium sp. M0142 TaxID=2956894 RepID=UPI0033354642